MENIRPHEAVLRGYLEAHFPSIDADDVVQEFYLKLFRMRAVQKITAARLFFFSMAPHRLHRMRLSLHDAMPAPQPCDELAEEGSGPRLLDPG